MPSIVQLDQDLSPRPIPPTQDPPRPPSPEPTIAVYENIANLEDNLLNHDPSPSPWKTISVRLVGSHPLWGHHLYVRIYPDTHQKCYLPCVIL